MHACTELHMHMHAHVHRVANTETVDFWLFSKNS